MRLVLCNIFLCVCIFLQGNAAVLLNTHCQSLNACSPAEKSLTGAIEKSCCNESCAPREREESDKPFYCSKSCHFKALNFEDLWPSNTGKRLINYACGKSPPSFEPKRHLLCPKILRVSRDVSRSRLHCIIHFGVRLI